MKKIGLVLFKSLVYILAFFILVATTFLIYKKERLFKIERKEINTLRASIITDIDHCPSRSPVPERLISDFIFFSKNKKIDFVISLGDNASHRLRNCSETGDLDARFIVEKIRETNKPSYFVIGDHDIASDPKSYQEWLKTTQRDTTYFSFDVSSVHVIVLDSVLGGEALSPPCEELKSCKRAQKRLEDLENMDFVRYRKTYEDSLDDSEDEKDKLELVYDQEQETVKETRSSGRRDKGRISEKELDWLDADIANTQKERILIFSDHPLFPFTSERKSYDIVNGEKVRRILEQSKKQIVCISGEAHLWHDETINGIQYYIIDEFRNANGSWALFSWDESGYSLEKITH